MWFFGKKKAEAIRKEAEEMLRSILNNAAMSNELHTAEEISAGIRDSFLDMNSKLLEAFDKAQQAITTNSTSIEVLSKSLSHLLEAYYVIEERIHIIENQLSTANVKFTKNNTN
jgi:hypothetical protein